MPNASDTQATGSHRRNTEKEMINERDMDKARLKALNIAYDALKTQNNHDYVSAAILSCKKTDLVLEIAEVQARIALREIDD
jgi:hypothetical protein